MITGWVYVFTYWTVTPTFTSVRYFNCLWNCCLIMTILMRTAFFAPSTFLHITRDKCSFSCHAMPHAKSPSLLIFSSSSSFCPKQLPKVSHRMNVPFSFSRDDDDQMIAGKEFQTIPRHSGRGAATVWAGCRGAPRLFCCGNIWDSFLLIACRTS